MQDAERSSWTDGQQEASRLPAASGDRIRQQFGINVPPALKGKQRSQELGIAEVGRSLHGQRPHPVFLQPSENDGQHPSVAAPGQAQDCLVTSVLVRWRWAVRPAMS